MLLIASNIDAETATNNNDTISAQCSWWP